MALALVVRADALNLNFEAELTKARKGSKDERPLVGHHPGRTSHPTKSLTPSSFVRFAAFGGAVLVFGLESGGENSLRRFSPVRQPLPKQNRTAGMPDKGR